MLLAVPRVMMVRSTLEYASWRDSGCTGMIVGRALIPDSMVIPGSSGSLQMVDHTLINVTLASVYLDSLYYNGHYKIM